MTRKHEPATLPDKENIAASQGPNDYKVGPGHPPREYQFKPGESGNPDGPPPSRTQLWRYICQYMALTVDERAKVDRTKLTAAQETAFQMVERAVKGEGCGFERLARYIVDREEGKAAEHIIISDADSLTDAECDELRKLIRGKHTSDGRDTE